MVAQPWVGVPWEPAAEAAGNNRHAIFSTDSATATVSPASGLSAWPRGLRTSGDGDPDGSLGYRTGSPSTVRYGSETQSASSTTASPLTTTVAL